MLDTPVLTVEDGQSYPRTADTDGLLESLCMYGSILSNEHCECGRKFTSEHKDKRGFFCPDCHTRPTRYHINARSFGLDYIFSDVMTCKVFENYSDALDVLVEMNRDFKKVHYDKKRFPRDNWLKEKVHAKRIENIFADWVLFVEAEMNKIALSKSRVQNIKKCERHILDYFRGWDIRDIKDTDIKKFYLTLLGKCRYHYGSESENFSCPFVKCPSRLSLRYIKDIMDTLKSIFLEHLPANVPKFHSFAVVPKMEKQMLGLTREMAVMDKVPEKYRLGILILILTGMHIDELPAIKVVDCVDGILYVTKAFTEGRIRNARKSGGTVEYRLTLEVWNMLMEHIKRKDPDDFVFDIDGRNIPPGRWYKVWKKACADAKVKHITLQQASRHSTATTIWNKHKKAASQEIAEQLGHNNLTTAQKHYIIEDRNRQDK